MGSTELPMVKEMYYFSTLQKMTLHHCYISTVDTDLLHKYKDVFEGLGDLLSEYHIVTDEVVPPVYQLLYTKPDQRETG